VSTGRLAGCAVGEQNDRVTSDLTLPQESLWWTDPAPGFPALEGEADVDVLIAGGGIAGVSLAWTLAEQDTLAGVLEAGRLAAGATGRSAGFLLAGPAEPYQEMIALWGRDGARALLDSGRRSHERVRTLVQTLGLDCDYRPSGSHRLAVDADEAEALRASLPLMRADGFPMDEVPLSHAVPPHAAEHFEAAFLTPEDGEFDPVRFVRGLAAESARRGARIFEGTPLVGARWRAGLWEVRTERGLVRARVLVLCTNAWVSRLVPALSHLITPHRAQLLATAPLRQVVAGRPACARWGYHLWRQTPDGRLVIGGWREVDRDAEAGYGSEVTGKVQEAIEAGLRVLVPGGAPIERRWAGTVGFARDGRPFVGWLDATHHLAICAGFTGHGLGLAPACTLDLAAQLQFKEAPGITGYDPARYPELRTLREGVTLLGAAAA
jgi:glycine/D-amino acid oxidase-like deaminating enzyme